MTESTAPKTLHRCECRQRLVTRDGKYLYFLFRKSRRGPNGVWEYQCPKCRRWLKVDELPQVA